MQPVPAPLDSLMGCPFFILKMRKLKPRDVDVQEAWGVKLTRATNTKAGAQWKDSVPPLAGPTTAPQTGPYPFKVTILISRLSKLILINYINYHKPLCMSKSQSDFWRHRGICGWGLLHRSRLSSFSSPHVSLCRCVYGARAIQECWAPISAFCPLSSLLSPRLLPKRLHLHPRLRYSRSGSPQISISI